MTIPLPNGGALRLPRTTPVRAAAEALRLAGYRLTTTARGRLIAERLH